jgi:hypothetical protein
MRQRVTVDNLSTGQSWSLNIANPWPGGSGNGRTVLRSLRARAGDRLRVRQPGCLTGLLLRGRILPRWRAYSALEACDVSQRIRLGSSRLRAPAIIGISARSQRSPLRHPG